MRIWRAVRKKRFQNSKIYIKENYENIRRFF